MPRTPSGVYVLKVFERIEDARPVLSKEHPMNRPSLPTRLTFMMTATILLFIATVGGAVVWMTVAMDRRAAEDSVRLMRSGLAGIRESLETVVVDYNKWDAAYISFRDRNDEWIYDNYAAAVETGVAMDIMALFGGPIGQTQSWTDNGNVDSVPDLVPRAVLDTMQRRISEFDLDSYRTSTFSAMIDGVPFILSGARVEPYDVADFPGIQADDLAYAVFGKRLSQELLTTMGDQLLLSDVVFSSARPDHPAFVALGAADGGPVGYVSWAPARPGLALLEKMAPMLGGLAALFVLITGWVTLTARKSAITLVNQEAHSAQMARTDALTGLPNRLAFHEHLETCPETGTDNKGVLFIDVNGFKRVNDTIGHEGGDDLVRALALRLENLGDDQTHLARVGGDEFVFVCMGDVVRDRIRTLASAVKQAVVPAFPLAGQHFTVTVAQGFATNERPIRNNEELVRRADLAMYHAKRSSDPDAVAYSAGIETHSREDKIIEDALRLSLERPEDFTICYQPIVDAGTGRMVKAEALARWKSPVIGSVPPNRFIDIAEKSGLMIELGRVLLTRICADLIEDPSLLVSVNISPLQLQMPNFVDELMEVLRTSGISPERIELELTEGVAVENAEMAAFKLDLLHDLGFHTALDDFGTGFSSIGYLRRLPFDTLKIDRSFVADLGAGNRPDNGSHGGGSNEQMVGSIIQLGHSLNKVVVCEGIETARQADVLCRLGCDLLQGYLYSKPVPLAQLRTDFPAQDDRAAKTPTDRPERSTIEALRGAQIATC